MWIVSSTNRIPDVEDVEKIASHVDKALLSYLEAASFNPGKSWTINRERGKSLPPVMTYTSQGSGDESIAGSSDEDDVVEGAGGIEQLSSDDDLIDISLLDPITEPDDGDGDAARSTEAGNFLIALYEVECFIAQVHKDQTGIKNGYTMLSYMAICD